MATKLSTLPSFALMAKHYPQGNADEIKNLIGGKVDATWYENTCAIRISRALNYSSAYKIPRSYPIVYPRKNVVISGDDKKWYIYRIKVLIRYLEHVYGKPQLQTRNAIKARKFLKGKKGIIIFRVKWFDAEGHATLWNGYRCIGQRENSEIGDCYFGKASEILFWQAKR